MDADEDWTSILQGHPIFFPPKADSSSTRNGESAFALSQNALSEFAAQSSTTNGSSSPGRRQVMLIRDSDIIVAVGKDIRIASLGDARLHPKTGQSFKALHTPNVDFDIHTMSLNPNAKLLAVAGAFQVAVVVLPRPSFTRLVPAAVDCKSIQVGQYYHASSDSPPIAKIAWHPWGEGGTTLMVMTTDGKLREYDISVDTEEPQQVLSFVPEKKSKSYLAEDSAEREVASFTFGKGKADWGPLTVYALMKSGDIYAICPYMPRNSSVPSSYIHALECFVHAKKEYLSNSKHQASSSTSLTTLYDYQHKYVSALVKQLPPGSAFFTTSRSVLVHPPSTIKTKSLRQGPFLLQPSPRILEHSEGGDATDVIYVAIGSDGEDVENNAEQLGVILVVSQDGKVDVCLDVEKVEAKWEHRQHASNDLPMLAIYETIDLGTVAVLKLASISAGDSLASDLLDGSHPSFFRDPIREEVVYVYHAFGVHALHLASLAQFLTAALGDDTSQDGGDAPLRHSIGKAEGAMVQPLVTTFSAEKRSSNPVIGVAIPNDVYLTYSIFILTSAMRVVVFPLSLHSDPPPLTSPPTISGSLAPARPTLDPDFPPEPPLYVSLLHEPYVPDPILTRPLGPRLALSQQGEELRLTPDTLRFLATSLDQFMAQVRDVHVAHNGTNMRVAVQRQEFFRQQEKCQEIVHLVEQLRGTRQDQTKEKLERMRGAQKILLERMERTIRVLMRNASPELSEHETKWFEELERMKQEVVGSTRYDTQSLVTRSTMLRRELDRMLPNLKELHEKEERTKKKLADHSQGFGLSQAFELGERSNAERATIRSVETEIMRLAAKLDMNLGRPPDPLAEGRLP